MAHESRRRIWMKLYDHRYEKQGHIGAPCTYCGLESSEWDHVPPLHYVSRIADHDIDNLDEVLRKLPSCRECNSILGGTLLTTIPERRGYLKEKLRRKYRSHAAMPEWSEEELEELSTDDARRYMRQHDQFAHVLKQRLGYYGRRRAGNS